VFGVAALGLYQMAFMISNLPTTETSRVISYVTFPAYSHIQDDIDRLRNAYLKVLHVVLFVSIPVAGTIFIFAQDAIYFLLSEKWIAVVPLLKILIVAGLAQAFIDTTGSVFNACGKPSINTKWQLASFLVLLILLYPVSGNFGLKGVAMVVVAANTIAAAVAVYELRKVLCFGLSDLLKPLLCPLASMTTAGVIVIYIGNRIQANNIIEILFLLTTATVLYSLFLLGFDKTCNYRIQTIIKETYRSLRANQL
jgi:O-antigen/teichoic acid export membrane protein